MIYVGDGGRGGSHVVTLDDGGGVGVGADVEDHKVGNDSLGFCLMMWHVQLLRTSTYLPTTSSILFKSIQLDTSVFTVYSIQVDSNILIYPRIHT